MSSNGSAAQPDASFDGIFASQVIEHLKPADVPRLVKLCAAKLKRDGVLALETPNPECLAIFATHFYLDPTHQRPVPPAAGVLSGRVRVWTNRSASTVARRQSRCPRSMNCRSSFGTRSSAAWITPPLRFAFSSFERAGRNRR